MQNGYLKINVYTANRLLPLGGAQIAVYDENGNIIGYRVSDKSGNAQTITISAPNKDLSESPGNSSPFTSVDVAIRAKGYVPVRYNGIQVFAGETSVLNADMIPLADNRNLWTNGEYNLKPQTL